MTTHSNVTKAYGQACTYLDRDLDRSGEARSHAAEYKARYESWVETIRQENPGLDFMLSVAAAVLGGSDQGQSDVEGTLRRLDSALTQLGAFPGPEMEFERLLRRARDSLRRMCADMGSYHWLRASARTRVQAGEPEPIAKVDARLVQELGQLVRNDVAARWAEQRHRSDRLEEEKQRRQERDRHEQSMQENRLQFGRLAVLLVVVVVGVAILADWGKSWLQSDRDYEAVTLSLGEQYLSVREGDDQWTVCPRWFDGGCMPPQSAPNLDFTVPERPPPDAGPPHQLRVASDRNVVDGGACARVQLDQFVCDRDVDAGLAHCRLDTTEIQVRCE